MNNCILLASATLIPDSILFPQGWIPTLLTERILSRRDGYPRIIADLLSLRPSGAEEEKNILDRCAKNNVNESYTGWNHVRYFVILHFRMNTCSKLRFARNAVSSYIFLLLVCIMPKEKCDLIVYNARIYTVDESLPPSPSRREGSISIKQALAVKHGRIVAVGYDDEILTSYEASETFDAQGKPLYPGFIDAHCHFLGYGLTLNRVDLVGTKSFEEVIRRVVDFRETHPGDEWILGRGWDQNDWEEREFPDNSELDRLFPDVPVYLRRVDGHAAIVNSEALRRAGITPETKIEGGLVETKDGKLTGMLIDNAIGLVAKVVPGVTKRQMIEALLAAQKNCFGVGLTTVDDAGLDRETIELIDSLQKSGELKMRIYAMVSAGADNLNYYLQRRPYKTERLNVRSFKFYADGALGSRGALLLEPYSDKPGHFGFLVNDIEYLLSHAERIANSEFQMATHCIGDSANRLMLDIYGSVLKGTNDRRWRIEHAQVVSPEDFKKFGLYNIIPSVQPVHATSDMYWADERLGPERVKGAYAYRDLLKQNGMIACGSDFPVESINPLLGFYAAVSRKDLNGYPENGFQIWNALTREDALKGMTIWAAYSNFEEKEKGSIEPGKFADLVILDRDIMAIPLEEIPTVKVVQTFVNGVKVY
jgi:predicted amidohydrolase YtcJ